MLKSLARTKEDGGLRVSDLAKKAIYGTCSLIPRFIRSLIDEKREERLIVKS